MQMPNVYPDHLTPSQFKCSGRTDQ